MNENAKKKRVKWLVACVLVVCVALVSVLYVPGLCLNNKCASYVEKYLYQLPTDENTLDDIDKKTEEFLEKDTFHKNYMFSKFQFDYIPESLFFEGDVGVDKTDMKQEAFIEVVILRLRILAIQGRYEEYKKLFFEYCDDIAMGFFTGCKYIEYWQRDENYPIEPNDEVFSLIITEYKKIISACTDDVDRYYMLYELQCICMPYDHYDEEVEWTQQEIIKILAKNKGNQFEQKILDWDGF